MLRQEPRWHIFFHNIQQDLKLFLFICLVFSLFRIGFIGVFYQYLQAQTTIKEIVEALFFGFRISLKSAGGITLLSFLFCTLLSTILGKRISGIRLFLGSLYIGLLSLLFNARLPFYQEFRMVFNQFMFNTFRDDTQALFYTLLQQYQLVERLAATVVLAFFLSFLYQRLLKTKTYPTPAISGVIAKGLFRVGVIVFIMAFMLFVRFGGSFTYANSIHWENSALSRDEFLNEAILDDVQALYRAYSSYERLQEATGLKVQTENIKEYAQSLSGTKVDSSKLADYLKKEAQGAKIEKPKHIFVIIGESYSGWPVFAPYANLNVANGIKSIVAKDNAIYLSNFLPNGTGTIEAVNGVISGLAEVNLFPNYQPLSYKEPYSTAFASQMKRLGYKTVFWYGGFSSWQKTKAFALSQGFDEYYGANDMQLPFSNAWGTDDKVFLQGISQGITEDIPTFNVILTTSNHPPYTVDLQGEGFDENALLNALPEEYKNDKDLVKRLGHYWYADKVMQEFIEGLYKKYPDSLFLLTGDHDCRYYTKTNPSLKEQKTIPFLIYGKGVRKELVPSDAAGSHLNIMPTLIELIAPKGFVYYSLVPSLTRDNKVGINRDYWITSEAIGQGGKEKIEYLKNDGINVNREDIQKRIEAVQAISWWQIHNGNTL